MYAGSIQKAAKISKGYIFIKQAFLDNRWHVDRPQVWRENGVNLKGVLVGETAHLTLRC